MTTRRDLAVGYCSIHQKLSYRNRKDARHIARRHPDRKSAFICDPDAIFPVWHIGSLPDAVKRGDAGREDIFRRVA